MRPLLFASLVAVAASASAEENRWNIHLQPGALITLKQPDPGLSGAITNDTFKTGGFAFKVSVEAEIIERVGVEVGYGLNLLFQNVTGNTGAQQLIFAGARVRPWWHPTGGYLLPRPEAAKDRKPFYFPDLISDAWIDAHIGLALADRTRFAYDIGIGTRVAVIWPLQIGIFARWQHLLSGGGDGGYMQVLVGLTFAVGFQSVHPEPDADGDGVPDAKDHCPGTERGVRVNEFGCEIRQSDTAAPKCSDTDLDGVCDGEDDCPDTKLGTAVDKHGCPIGGNAPQETPNE